MEMAESDQSQGTHFLVHFSTHCVRVASQHSGVISISITLWESIAAVRRESTFPNREALRASRGMKMEVLAYSHCHIAVRTAVSKGSPLLLKGNEVPDGHHGVIRHVEVEQLHAGEGAECV